MPGSPDPRSATATLPREEAETTRIIAVVNQKGGVGKSTTAVSLGAALAEAGVRVLVMDLDPQGNASTGLGIEHARRNVTTYDILTGDTPAREAVMETTVPRLWAIPSTIDLAGAEIELVSQFSREMRLRRAIEDLSGWFDFILLDCPPSLGLLTVNALAAADELIVPIQCEYYALEGLGQLLRNVRLVQHNLNPRLRLSGIVLTMFDPRTRLSEQVVSEVRRYFGPRVYDTVIPRTVRLSEAPGYGMPITVYDPRSKGADSYRDLAREVLERPVSGEPLPTAEPPAVILPEPPGAAVPGGPAGSTEPGESPPSSGSRDSADEAPPDETPPAMGAAPTASAVADAQESRPSGSSPPGGGTAEGNAGAGDGGDEESRRRWRVFRRREGGDQ